jgi:cytochrome c5
MRKCILPCALLCAALLAACQPKLPEPGASDISRADSLRPGNTQLSERYERSCHTCHGRPGTGAPLTGFAPAWQAPLKKGLDQLQQHAMQGFNAMPAKGLCNDCSEQDIRALIQFMAGV